MLLPDASFAAVVSRPRAPAARPPRPSRDLPPKDPRESLPYELRGLVNQVLGRHLRGEAVQGTLVGGPGHGERYGGTAEEVTRVVHGAVHRYRRLPVPVTRRRRGALTLFAYAGVGAQQAMDLG